MSRVLKYILLWLLLSSSLFAQSLCPPDSGLESITLYDGAFFGNKGFKAVAVSRNGTPYNQPRPAWGSDPTYTSSTKCSPMAKSGDICGTADWGSLEYHRIPAIALQGQQWLWIDGYGPSDGSAFYPVETIRADWVNLDTGVVQDVTPLGPAPQGQPYMPSMVYKSGHYRIRIWGWIWNSMTSNRSNLFYWESDITYGQTMYNPAWKGDQETTKPVIIMREGWWDSNGWITRSTGTSPYDSNNNPIVPVNTYLGYNAAARGVGTMWVYSFAPNVAGMESIR